MRYVFGDCVFDTERYVLHRAGQPIRLRPKVFQVLIYLLAHRERVITKQELSEQVWHGRFISDATLESTLAAVRRGLEEVGMTPDEEAPYLLQFLEVPGELDLTATHRPQAIRARTSAILVQLALQGARRRPLVLEVENLHWIDPSSEEVLTALVERLAGAAILLLVTYRPGYRLPWMDKSYITQVALSPLAPADSRQVVLANLRTTPVAEALVQTIVAKGEGNPFFLEELARAVGEHDVAQVWPAGVPETVQAVLAARIDRLPPAAKHVLQMAAVIGKEVPFPLLHAVAGLSEDRLEQGLRRLQAAEFLDESGVVPDRVYTFRHVLMQEVAYQSLLADTRQQIHQRTAQELAARFPATVSSQPELVAYHYTEAGLTEPAIAYWQQAGQQSLQCSANAEAVQHLTKGLALLATLPQTRARAQQELDLLIALGHVLMLTKGIVAPEVEQVYIRARALCQQVEKTPQLLQVLQRLCAVYMARGELHTALELGELLLTLTPQVEDATALLAAHSTLAENLFYLGEFARARTCVEEGIGLSQRQPHHSRAFRRTEVFCLSQAAMALGMLGYPDQALERMHEALALTQELSYPPNLVYALHFAALVHQHRREGHATYARAAAVITLASEQGFPLWLARGMILQGWARAQQGDGEAGIAQIHQGLAAMRATGPVVKMPYYFPCWPRVWEGRAGRRGTACAGRGPGDRARHRGTLGRAGAVSAHRRAAATPGRPGCDASRSLFPTGSGRRPLSAGQILGASGGAEPESVVAAAGQA